MIYTAKDSASILTALKSAKSGDVIELEAVDYGNLRISGISVAGNVTITSKTPGGQASFSSLSIVNSAGITLSNVELAAPAGAAENPFKVASCSNIVLDRLNVHGTMDGSPDNDPSLMIVRDSSNITVRNSEFQQAGNALCHLNVNGLVISENSFHDIRADGVRGGGSSNVKVMNNSFTDFYQRAGDHSDAIQFWTVNTSTIARNIEISGNLITRGNGGPMQGLFMRQEDDLPFTNVMISNNLMVGTLYNGIAIMGAADVTLRGNSVEQLADQKSWIRLERVTGASLDNNSAGTFLLEDVPNIDNTNSTIIGTLQDGGLSVIQSFIASHPLVPTNNGIASLPILSPVPDPVPGPAGGDVGGNKPNPLSPVVYGTEGQDSLRDKDGQSVLNGGNGDDKYTVSHVGTTVSETATGGTDYVYTAMSYQLDSNVENLSLLDGAVSGTGNELNNIVNGNEAANVLSGLDGDDRINGRGGDDAIDGGNGIDYLTGGFGADLIDGGAGDDRLLGEAGDDMLIGGAGNDYMIADVGNDLLLGGAGSDIMLGGAGADSFIVTEDDFLAPGMLGDRIADFCARDGDKICLSGLDANLGTDVVDPFRFIGKSAFSKLAGQIRFDTKGNSTIVLIDRNGDGVSDFNLTLSGVTSLSVNDFVL